MSDAITIADQEHATIMERGSNMLLHAIRMGRSDRHNLIWRSTDTRTTWPTGSMSRERYRAAMSLAEKEAAMGKAVNRDACTYCGTRADIGCQHQRAA